MIHLQVDQGWRLDGSGGREKVGLTDRVKFFFLVFLSLFFIFFVLSQTVVIYLELVFFVCCWLTYSMKKKDGRKEGRKEGMTGNNKVKHGNNNKHYRIYCLLLQHIYEKETKLLMARHFLFSLDYFVYNPIKYQCCIVIGVCAG